MASEITIPVDRSEWDAAMTELQCAWMAAAPLPPHLVARIERVMADPAVLVELEYVDGTLHAAPNGECHALIGTLRAYRR